MYSKWRQIYIYIYILKVGIVGCKDCLIFGVSHCKIQCGLLSECFLRFLRWFLSERGFPGLSVQQIVPKFHNSGQYLSVCVGCDRHEYNILWMWGKMIKDRNKKLISSQVNDLPLVCHCVTFRNIISLSVEIWRKTQK